MDHQRQANAGSDVIICPFCRGEFASPKLLALEFRNTWHENKKASDRLDVHTGITCNNCRLDPIKVNEIKSLLRYTRGCTPKRVTSGGVHLGA